MQSPVTPRPSAFSALLQAARNIEPEATQGNPSIPTLGERQRDGNEAIEELRNSPRPR